MTMVIEFFRNMFRKRKGREMIGLFSQLTDDQKAQALSYRGDESHGLKEFLRKD